MCMCTYVHTNVCAYTCRYVCKFVRKCVCVRMCVRMFVCIYVYMEGSRKGDQNIVCSTKQAGQLPAAGGCSYQLRK